MADHSPIEWTDATWNPIVGCSVTSPGCTNCYAMSMARRIEAMQSGSHYAGTTQVVNGKPVWTGKVALAPEHIMNQPARWHRPRRIFVNSMGDLFHEDVPDDWIDQVFSVMATCPQHIFQVLTKRSARMRAYISDPETRQRSAGAFVDQIVAGSLPRRALDKRPWPVKCFGDSGMPDDVTLTQWPLPNVWLGVSTEDQRRADERRDDLAALAASGWTTFASYEPALGPINWTGWDFLRLLISGGESGPSARPSHPDWHRAARDFCAPGGIAFFFKQWGEWAPRRAAAMEDLFDARRTQIVRPDGGTTSGLLAYDETAWVMDRVGKRNAGRLLDGVEHNDMPEART